MINHDYDTDPEALAWARAKIEFEIARCNNRREQAKDRRDTTTAEHWRRTSGYLRRRFITRSEGAGLAAFDERHARPRSPGGEGR